MSFGMTPLVAFRNRHDVDSIFAESKRRLDRLDQSRAVSSAIVMRS